MIKETAAILGSILTLGFFFHGAYLLSLICYFGAILFALASEAK